MIILHLHETLGFAGGAEQYLFNVASKLANLGHQNFLIYQEASGYDWDFFSKPFNETFQILKLSEVQTLPKFDIAYFHKWMQPFEKLKGAMKSSLPTFQFIHDHDSLCLRTHKSFYFSGKACPYPIGFRCLTCLPFSTKISNGSIKNMIRPLSAQKKTLKVLENHTNIFVGSSYLRNQFCQNGFPANQIVINPLFTDFSPKFFSFPQEEEPSILYVGRLDRGKGLDLLLHSLKKVKNRFRLLIVGEGKNRDEFKSLAQQYQMNGRINFLGEVTHSSLPSLYRSVRMVVVPSRSPETFGLSAIEGMAHGRPPVAFRVGALEEVIEHRKTGLLAEEQNITSLAHHIDCLLENKELAEALGKAGVEKVQTIYNPKRHIQTLLRFFSQSITENSSVTEGSSTCFV